MISPNSNSRPTKAATNSADSARQDNAKEDLIYFARGTKSGLIKVGLSYAPEKRCKELRAKHGEPVEVLFAFPGTFEIEQAIHFAFRAQPGAWELRDTEWYKPVGLIAHCVEFGITLVTKAGSSILGAPRSESTLHRKYGPRK